MPVRTLLRATLLIAVPAVIAAPAAAQSTLGPYAPAVAKYRITSITNTTQTMMGQFQSFETTANQLLSLSITKAADALTVSIAIDSASITTTAPGAAAETGEMAGTRLTGSLTPEGKVGTADVTDKSGAPSASSIANSLRSFLPRLRVGATKGTAWVDSNTTVSKQNDADVTMATVVNYTLAGDTSVAGVKAWKIVAASSGKLTGTGNRMGASYSLDGRLSGTAVALVSTAGVLIGETSDSDSNITVTVEAAGMTIPIVQKSTTRVEKLP